MKEEEGLAIKVVNTMFANDWFSQWLGIQLMEVLPGSCTLHMKVKSEMLNGFSIAHGGITYSLADSALAFASNSHGRKCISVETSISHTVSLKEGDRITAKATEVYLGNKTAIYEVKISNQDNLLVAVFKGTVYRTSKLWFGD